MELSNSSTWVPLLPDINSNNSSNRHISGTVEMTRWLRTGAGPAEDLSLVPSAHVGQHTTAWNPSFRGSATFFCGHLHSCAHALLIHIDTLFFFFKKSMYKLYIAAHDRNCRTWEVKAGELAVQGQPELYKTSSEEQNQEHNVFWFKRPKLISVKICKQWKIIDS